MVNNLHHYLHLHLYIASTTQIRSETTMKLLHLIRPILPLLPEIEKPAHRIPRDEKALWTVLAL